MSVKKFVAPDMRQALKLVRDQMGPDAVILSNRKVASGVEITAAMDYDDVLEKHKQKQRRDARLPDFADEKTAASVPVVQTERLIKPVPERQDRDTQRNVRAVVATRGEAAARGDRDLNDALVNRSEHLANLRGAQLAAVKASVERKMQEKAPEPQWDENELEMVSPAETAERKHETQLRRQFREKFETQDTRLAFENEAAATQARELSAMRSELNKLRALLDTRFAHVAWSDYSNRHPVEASVYRQLHRMGISASICRRLVDSMPTVTNVREGLRAAMQRLHKELNIYEPDVRETGGVIALLGPAGVGKTTSISKIAAAYAMRHGIDEVALITTDSYRIAGHEQLKTLGKILRVPMRVVTDQHPLEQVLEQLSNKKLVLIDTAGLSNRDQDFDEQMKILERLPVSVTRWLVLASTSQKRILEKAVEDYQTLRLDGCILTKLDECASLGEALSVVVDAQLPVAYTTDGQNIPDDIERPRVADLLGHAMELATRSELQDEDTAEWFSDEMAQQPAFDGAA